MKNQTQLLNCILIMTLSCFYQFAKAQIVYTDVNPDVTTGASYSIDLNNDGITDFILTASDAVTGFCYPGQLGYAKVVISPLASNQVADTVFSQARMLNANEPISNGIPLWSNGGGQLLRSYGRTVCSNYGGYTGYWTADIKYLGVKLADGNNTMFGWIRLGLSVFAYSASFTIYDYAYNSIPNQSILAGQTCPPFASITSSGPTTFCAGDSVMLSSVNSGTNLSYTWKLNGANISGATNKSYTAKTGGNYKVKVTDNTNSCSASSAKVKVKVPCKMMDESEWVENNSLKIYPNPFSQSTLITFQLPRDENVSLKIFDVRRRLIRTLAQDAMSAGVHTLTWDAQDESGNAMNAGIYLLQFSTSENSQTIRLSVMK